MITIPFTTFDQAIRHSLENTFIELLKIYQQQNGYTFHFIGQSKFINLSEDDLTIYPDDFPDYDEKFLYLKNRVEETLKKHSCYPNLASVYLKERECWHKKENLEQLGQLIAVFNQECAAIIQEFISETNDRLCPLHRHYQINAFGLDELIEICVNAGHTENKVADFFVGIKPVDATTTVFQVQNCYDALFGEMEFEDRIETLLGGLLKTEFWQFHKANYLDKKAIIKIQKEEYERLPEETFKTGFDFAKGIDNVLDYMEESEAFKRRFPVSFYNSDLYYEFFEEELIISNHAYIIHHTMYGKESIDWDNAPAVWIPREVLSEYEGDISNSVLLFLIRKLYYFQENLFKHLQEVKRKLCIKNDVQAIKYLLGYFKKIVDNPTLKIRIIEGIKLSKSINDLYLESILLLLKKRLHQEKGTLFKEKFTLAEDPFTLKDVDFQIEDALAERIATVIGSANNPNEFYYPTKLYWNTKVHGDLYLIFKELNSSDYLYKGQPYMELADINTFIQRNFTFEPNPMPIEKNQVSLPFNSFIGPIRLFLYLFKDKFYNVETEERFAQMLRDNFYRHFQKHKIDLTFESLSKIASNLHKGSNKIDIKLPK